MFSNLSWYEVVALLLLALFIFGDKLPKVIGDGLRMLRNLRRMAQNATSDLSRELGTDIQLDDLNPRTFVRKHLLSEADQERLLSPLKGVSDDVMRQTRGVQQDLQEAGQVAGEVRRSASWRAAVAGPSGAANPAPAAAKPAPAAAKPAAAAGEPATAVTAQPDPAPAADRAGYEDIT